MMNARLNKALVALLAVSAGACGDAPVDVAQNEPDRLVTNPSFVVIEAGETRLVQAYLVNALSNPVAGDVDFEACNGAITVENDPNQTDLEPGTNFLITGNTLGTSCVNVSGSGEEATINVRVVPAELELTLSDTILSGAGEPAGVTFLNASGTAATGFDLDEVSFSSLDTLVAVVDPATGDVTARAPGTVSIVVTLDDGLGAARADTFSVVVVPGTFDGSFSDDTPGENQQITISAGDAPFDADTRIWMGEEEAHIVSFTADELVVVVPENHDGTYLITGIGPNQIAQGGTYTPGADATANVGDGVVYYGVFSGDDTDDTFFVTVPSTGTYAVSIAFTNAADVDAYMTQDFVLNVCADDQFVCSAATGDNPETVTAVIEAGDYEILVFLYDPHGVEVTDYTVTFDLQ